MTTKAITIFLELPESAEVTDDIADDAESDTEETAVPTDGVDESGILLLYVYIILEWWIIGQINE